MVKFVFAETICSVSTGVSVANPIAKAIIIVVQISILFAQRSKYWLSTVVSFCLIYFFLNDVPEFWSCGAIGINCTANPLQI